MKIQCANPLAEYNHLQEQIDGCIHDVLISGQYILGRQVDLFEGEFAGYTGANYTIGVNSGTDAIHIALRSCGIGPGDEVLTVSHTAVATVTAVEQCGATPVFVDIDPLTYTMNPDDLNGKITKRTKAILPVHLYGHPADMHTICSVGKQNGLYVIEDCAQAHGARIDGKMVGTFGDIGCFSFYPTKNLGTVGDAGAIISNNFEMAENARKLRQYGWRDRYISDVFGINSRIDELHAAILRVKLKHLNDHNKLRVSIAKRYMDALNGKNAVLPSVKAGAEHVFHLFVIRVDQRIRIIERLRAKNIHAGIHYPVPVHLQPAFRRYACSPLPETEKAAEQVLSLPLYPYLEDSTLEIIIEALLEVLP